MKAATLAEIQKELTLQPPARVIELCLRVAKHKKENKELLTYLLFETGNEELFIASIKAEIDAQFLEINKANLYFSKKSLRKILRMINKFIKYSGNKQTEMELRIYYCTKLKTSGIKFRDSQTLSNLYNNQLKKIETVLSKMHEDIQYDFKEVVKKLL